MSKQNKVNPGMYTQKGRLTPDDTARELKRQREAAPPPRAQGAAPAPRKRVTDKDPPSPRGSSAASADKQQPETREAK